MIHNEGSSADMQIHLHFFLNKWNILQYYEGDETIIVTEQRYSQSSYTIHLNYDIFFRVQHAYNAISRALDCLGVDQEDSQAECINSIISEARQMCVNNMDNADHRINYLTCNLCLVDEHLVDESQVLQQSFEDQDDDGMVPAAPPAIRSLRTKRIKVEDGEDVQQCMVCLEEFTQGEKVTCMPCSHMFHKDCITKWLARSHLCPICRFEMPKDL